MPRMKRPKIKYHPSITPYDMIEKTDPVGQKNWLNLQCGKLSNFNNNYSLLVLLGLY